MLDKVFVLKFVPNSAVRFSPYRNVDTLIINENKIKEIKIMVLNKIILSDSIWKIFINRLKNFDFGRDSGLDRIDKKGRMLAKDKSSAIPLTTKSKLKRIILVNFLSLDIFIIL